jgi:signal transduction histidine kinase
MTQAAASEQTTRQAREWGAPGSATAADRAFTWASLLVGYVLFAGVLLRAVLTYRGTPQLGPAVALLAAYLGLYASLASIARRVRVYPAYYLALQTGLLIALLAVPDFQDYFVLLFAPLGAQAVQYRPARPAAAWLALFAGLIVVAMWLNFDVPSEALASTAVYLGILAFVTWHMVTCERGRAARARNQALLEQLEQTNRQLQAYAARLEQLSVARERSRLARELHDSVTQTIFSLTLTARSALLLLEREPRRVGPQLDRLQELAANALGEMHTLVAHLRPASVAEAGLVTALRQHLAARYLQDSLQVSLEADEAGSLSPAEAENLFRIIQEALNNVAKHAGTGRASVRLCLGRPAWVEVRDDGRGFPAAAAPAAGHLGFGLMRERAEEIGWRLTIRSAPGEGTRVRVAQAPQEVEA